MTISSLGGARINSEYSTLRQILKRADYATSDMQAAEGPDHDDEVVIIRRIEAGTISLKDYPASISRRERTDPDALACWENEGGAIGAAGELLKTDGEPQ